nr:hypothetical protein [uncultured Roseococcus sp.]
MTTMYARISEGRAAELIEILDGTPLLEERYHPDVVAACVEVPGDLFDVIAPGWSWDGEVFAPPAPPPSPALTEADYQHAIEAHVDAVARARRYSGAAACASYVASTEPVWAAEAVAFVAWRDAVYRIAFAALDLVMAGQAEPPTIGGFLASLPVIEWPEAAAL